MKGDDARARVERLGVWMMHDTTYPSLTTEVAGAPVHGSWWGHPLGKSMFNLGSVLGEDPDVLTLPLLSGKTSFVHRRLWSALYGAVGGGRLELGGSLPPALAALLADVDSAGEIEATGKDAALLATRLLAVSRTVHTEAGHHARRLESWARWAEREGVGTDPGGREILERVVDAAVPGSSSRLPWRTRRGK